MDNLHDATQEDLIFQEVIHMLGVSSYEEHASQTYASLRQRHDASGTGTILTDIQDHILRLSLFFAGVLPRISSGKILGYLHDVFYGVISLGVQNDAYAWGIVEKWARLSLNKHLLFCVNVANGVVKLALSEPDAGGPCLVVSAQGDHIVGATDPTIPSPEPKIVELTLGLPHIEV